MKNIFKMAFLSLGVLSVVVSCKGKTEGVENDAIVEQVAEYGIPNESDTHFGESLTALGNNDHSSAAMHLKKGIASLKEEGKDLTGESKDLLNESISKLNGIQKALSSNKKIDINDLQNAMANAELAVGHDYLITDDIYLLTPPEKKEDHLSLKEFKRNLNVLENTLKDEKTNKVKDEDGSGQKLYDEGKDLEKQLSDIMDKVKDHNKRANEHMKKHHPDHYYPPYL